MTVETFITMVGSFISTLGDAIAVFMQPPLVWFTGLSFVVAIIGIARKVIPAKKS